MIDFSIPAKEIFEILKSFGFVQVMYDVDGNLTSNPDDARRFFVKKENLLVSLREDSENSCVTMYKGNATPIGNLLDLIKTLRTNVTKLKLVFHIREYGKEITPKDFANLQESTKKEKEMNIFEGMYGTLGTSYLKLENAKMTVKHSRKSADPKVRARCIESIIFEDANGDTFQFATNNLVPAKAMAQHLNHGNGFADVVGQQITRMAQDYRNLATAVGQTSTIDQAVTPEPAAVLAVQEACQNQLKKLHETFCRIAMSECYKSEKDKLSKLNESLEEDEKTPEDELEEMSDLLMNEGKRCQTKIVEAACKAMKKEGKVLKEFLINEKKEDESNLVSVFGKKIDKNTWENFKNGVMNTKGSPEMSSPQYTSKTSEFLHKLVSLIPHIEDVALGNLISAIADKYNEVQNDKLKTQFRAVGMKALKNAGMSLNEGLATKNKAILEYQKWINSFDIVKESATGKPSGITTKKYKGHNIRVRQVNDAGKLEWQVLKPNDDQILGKFSSNGAARDFIDNQKKKVSEDEDFMNNLHDDDDDSNNPDHFGLETSSDSDLTEADDGSSDMINVMDKPIKKFVWDNFKHGVMDLLHKPDFSSVPKFTNKTAEMLYKAVKLVPLIKDDSLSILIDMAAEMIPEEQDADKKRMYQAIVSQAVKNANIEMPLHEDDQYGLLDEVEDEMLDDSFSPIAWWNSRARKTSYGINLGTDKLGGLAGTVTRDEVKDALVEYFSDLDEMMPEELAEEHLQQTVDYLAGKGYEITDNDGIDNEVGEFVDESDDPLAPEGYNSEFGENDEFEGENRDVVGPYQDMGDELEEADDNEIVNNYDYESQGQDELTSDDMGVYDETTFDPLDDGSDILDREDIILPSGNQQDSFRSEVVAKTVSDPITGEEENTDGDYLSRLRTLAGMTSAHEFDNG